MTPPSARFPSTPPAPTVVVLGGGFSGAMTALHLLRQATSPVRIHLVDKSDRVALGTAYGTPSWAHLLNVPAVRMGAVDDPEHFLRWIAAHPEALPQGAPAMPALGFAPRRTFGTYLRALFDEAVQSRPPHVTFEYHRDEALKLSAQGDRVLIALASGTNLVADRVVLALGNFPPRPLVADTSPFRHSRRYVNDPWAPGALTAVSDEAQPALLVGTGLTMVDVALSLRERRLRKSMLALSRRGYLPQVHRLGAPYPGPLPVAFPATTAGMLRWLRREVREGAKRGFSWHSVLDSLRPHTQSIWASLPPEERRRFLRHARVHWDVHRHRIAPEIADRLAAMRAGKQLSLFAGRIERFEETPTGVDVTYRPRGSATSKTVTVGHVVNCTGPDARYSPDVSPLVASLLEGGWVRTHAAGVGLDVHADGRVVQRDGSLSPLLYAVGPARQGTLWESVAVPELRGQAAAMATSVIASLTSEVGNAPSRRLQSIDAAPRRR